MTTIFRNRIARRSFLLVAGASAAAIAKSFASSASWSASCGASGSALKKAWEKIGVFFAPPADLAGDLGNYRPVLLFEDGRRVQSAHDWLQRRKELLRKWHSLLGAWPPLLEKPYGQEQFREETWQFVRRRIELEIAPGRKTTVYLLTPERSGSPEGPGPSAVIDVFYYPEDGAGYKSDRRRQNDFGCQLVQRKRQASYILS